MVVAFVCVSSVNRGEGSEQSGQIGKSSNRSLKIPAFLSIGALRFDPINLDSLRLHGKKMKGDECLCRGCAQGDVL